MKGRYEYSRNYRYPYRHWFIGVCDLVFLFFKKRKAPAKTLEPKEVIEMALIKYRSIDLENIRDIPKGEQIVKTLKEQPGMIDASINFDKGSIEFAYDLESINLTKVEEIIKQQGLALKGSLWQRLKRNWTHFTEENELENAHTPSAPCCSHPDDILAKAKQKT